MPVRRSFLLFCALVAGSATVHAAPVGDQGDFAALTIRPAGPEQLDLETGVTTLPEGGEISYRQEGVTLRGSFIRYLEGAFVEVAEAVVTGDFGTLEAPRLRFDVAAQTLVAESGASFRGEALELGADALMLNLGDDTAELTGNVRSTDPELVSARALVDLTGGAGVLVGPYEYQEGPVGLSGAAGELLALSWNDAGAVSAETQLPAALRERFAGRLP